MDAWVGQELAGGSFPDRRLRARLGKPLGDLGQRIGAPTPMACQDWAATEAAYRFFGNPRVDEGVILTGHFAAPRARFAATAGPILVLHDTTEFSSRRDNPEAIGRLSLLKTRHATVTLCGLLMHSSLVLTPQGDPLGLAAVKFWTRKKFKGANALRGKVNATRIPIEQEESVRWPENLKRSTELLGEPARCVHVGDRESDIYELFRAAREARTHFLVRTCVGRLAEGGGTTISEVMGREPVRGVHEVEVRDDRGRASTAELDVRFRRMTVRPPIGKQRRYPTLELTAIHADERAAPAGREPVRWRLLTDLAVDDLEAATGKLGWYAKRFKIETSHTELPGSLSFMRGSPAWRAAPWPATDCRSPRSWTPARSPAATAPAVPASRRPTGRSSGC
ncbi:IS4 family transposase [Tautonia plasticadhaerens]|uniref:Transposase for transposon Tn5 n=1 Tax=Tautonia plasticadhaerens TaxID=2527974 RepID=A0A518H8K2_9BACT|nr:IS4 family transposase [Tautonia plasticadhaerens]QDV37170.1 Transposase for transposon Tn5 [Tautonia plasticadhaerens]QDV37640.1 Transposase for transposon Tn5 [Tautonia plasticadhaerens]